MRYIIIPLFLSFFFQSCSLIGSLHINNAIMSSRTAFHNREYEKSLHICKRSLRFHSENQEIRRHCTVIFKEINEIADNASIREDYKLSGQLYNLLISYHYELSNLPSKKRLKFMKEYSIKKLLEKGYEEYRKGNIQLAVSIWSNVLELDPNNTEALRSLSTASIQLKNLQRIQ